MSSLLPFSTKDVAANASSGGTDGSSAEATSFWSSMFKEDEPDPWLPALSRQQRVVGFFTCLFVAIFCFGLSAAFLPIIYVKVGVGQSGAVPGV